MRIYKKDTIGDSPLLYYSQNHYICRNKIPSTQPTIIVNMKRCPKCGSGAQLTNGLAFYSIHAIGATIGVGAGLLASIFSGPGHGGHIADKVSDGITEPIKRHYKCTNPKCKHEWDFEKKK